MWYYVYNKQRKASARLEKDKRMTNAMIVLLESINLMEQGIIKGTGEIVKVIDENGEEKELELPEAIHTYSAWKSKGYQVKKGEKAVAKFPIWKYVSNVSKEVADAVDVDGKDHIDGTSKMFMKVSAFFTASQVEQIKQ